MFGNNNPLTFTEAFRSPGNLTAFPTANCNSVTIVTGQGNIFGINALNPNSTDAILRFYDGLAADIDAKITAGGGKLPRPFLTICVPGTGGGTGKLAGQFLIRGLDHPWHFSTALCARCSAAFGDADATTIAAAIVLEIDPTNQQTIRTAI